MKYISTLLMFMSFYANASCDLTPEQDRILRFAYAYGSPHDYGYTMVAIAMEESNLGEWKINLSDPSAGTWHTTIDKAVDKLGWKHTPFNYNRAAQKLIDDEYFAAAIALETLLWWDKVREGDWRKTVGSYNGGWKMNNDYVNRIAGHIRKIKDCHWLED